MGYLIQGQRLLNILSCFNGRYLINFIEDYNKINSQKYNIKQFFENGIIISNEKVESIHSLIIKYHPIDIDRTANICVIIHFLEKSYFYNNQNPKSSSKKLKDVFLEDYKVIKRITKNKSTNLNLLEYGNLNYSDSKISVVVKIDGENFKFNSIQVIRTFFEAIEGLAFSYENPRSMSRKYNEEELLKIVEENYCFLNFNENKNIDSIGVSDTQFRKDYSKFINTYIQNYLFDLKSFDLRLILIGRIFEAAELIHPESTFYSNKSLVQSYEKYDKYLIQTFKNYINRI